MAQNGKKLKLMTYNIHRGIKSLSKRVIEKQIGYLIHEYHPDIVCLQEVWRRNQINENELERFADEHWHHRCWGKNAVFPNGSQGNAVLSKHHIVHWVNEDITVYGREPRGILQAEIDFDGTRLYIFCVHFGLLRSERLYQKKCLFNLLEGIPENAPLVVAGDFNDWTRNAHQLMRQEGFEEAFATRHQRLPRTFPSYMPMLPLDRLYYRNLKVRKVHLHKSVFNSLSDHLPYYAEFFLPASSTDLQD